MITLYQFPSLWGLPNPSPFCAKVETYLRMTELPFKARGANPQKAPKKKLPYIDDEGTIVADSGAIVEHLATKRGADLDAKLGDADRALGHLVKRTFEESLYWPLVWFRWVDDEGWPTVDRDMLKPVLPPVLRTVLPPLIRRNLTKATHAQGIGRHERSEILAYVDRDLGALSTFLGRKPYFLGEEPSSVDATAYGFVNLLLWAPPAGNAVQQRTREHANLVAYAERMRDRYYGKTASA